jgi:hypothetical protein
VQRVNAPVFIVPGRFFGVRLCCAGNSLHMPVAVFHMNERHPDKFDWSLFCTKAFSSRSVSKWTGGYQNQVRCLSTMKRTACQHKQVNSFYMKRKKLIISILIGAAVGGATFYFLATKSGKEELKRLKKTGSVTADTFKILGEEVTRNVKQARKEERKKALKAAVQEALTAEV